MKEIYVKDGDMPESCAKCDLWCEECGKSTCVPIMQSSEYKKKVNKGEVWRAYISCNGRRHDCPLRPLSEYDKQVRAETAREIIVKMHNRSADLYARSIDESQSKSAYIAHECSLEIANLADELSEQYKESE